MNPDQPDENLKRMWAEADAAEPAKNKAKEIFKELFGGVDDPGGTEVNYSIEGDDDTHPNIWWDAKDNWILISNDIQTDVEPEVLLDRIQKIVSLKKKMTTLGYNLIPKKSGNQGYIVYDFQKDGITLDGLKAELEKLKEIFKRRN